MSLNFSSTIFKLGKRFIGFVKKFLISESIASESEAFDIFFENSLRRVRGKTIVIKSSLSSVRIERDAFVGTNAIVHPGVIIGEGAIIGSNSLVLTDVEPWTINVGSPCRAIKKRPQVNREDI